MAISDYRSNPRSKRSLREQYGPTLEEERNEALRRMMDRGETPSSFGSVKDFEAARQREIQAERDRVGPMAYDQAQGKMIPSPKARRERLSAEMEAAEKSVGEAKKRGDDFWKKRVVNEIVFDGPGRAGWADDGEQVYQVEAPSGGYVSVKGKDAVANIQASLDRDREEAARAEKFQTALADTKRRVAMTRLTDSGYDWKSEDSAELFNDDGSLNLDKAKRAADLAQGQKAQATFDAWDYDKQLDRDAQAIARDSRSRLRVLRGAAREGRATDKDLAEMRELERMVSLGDKPRNRDGLRAGFWRTEAEDQDRNRIAEVEKFRVLAESQQKQADAVRTKTESVGRPLTDEEIKGLGYPAWDDEVAWQELIKVNPAAAEIYKMRPVNVSKAGRAMSKALSVFA